MNPFLNNVERFELDIVSHEYGATLVAQDGRRYIDFWADESTYQYPLLAQVLGSFVGVANIPDIYSSPIRTKFAQALCDTYGFNRVFLSNSGAEGIETALKMVRKYQHSTGQQRRNICYTLRGNFHGRTYGALALSDSYGSGSPYHKEGYQQSSHGWPGYGVLDDSKSLLEQIDVERAAAVFVAPVLGNNVVAPYGRERLQRLRDFCTQHGLLLVFDEIQTGSGWTGKYSAAQYYGVQPDVMVLGKRIALGLPCAATLANEDVADAIGLGQHFNTFAGGPLVCAAGLEWLDWLSHGGLERIDNCGAQLEAALGRVERIESVQRVGMMISITPNYRGYDGFELCTAARERGLLIVTHRQYGEIRITPPCTISDAELQLGVGRLKSALQVV